MNKIFIGISSCLLGHRVRYDGRDKKHTQIIDIFSRFSELYGFCPEVEIGLGIPRTPIQLVKKNDQVRCIEMNHPKRDVTQELSEIAYSQKASFQKLSGYIFKKNSPSCGLSKVKMFVDDQVRLEETGIFSQEITKIYPLLPVEEEHRLENLTIRKKFIESVFMFYRWKQLTSDNFSEKRLFQFHQRYKKYVTFHPQFSELEKKLVEIDSNNFESFSLSYFCLLMKMFKAR